MSSLNVKLCKGLDEPNLSEVKNGRFNQNGNRKSDTECFYFWQSM